MLFGSGPVVVSNALWGLFAGEFMNSSWHEIWNFPPKNYILWCFNCLNSMYNFVSASLIRFPGENWGQARWVHLKSQASGRDTCYLSWHHLHKRHFLRSTIREITLCTLIFERRIKFVKVLLWFWIMIMCSLRLEWNYSFCDSMLFDQAHFNIIGYP